MATPAVESMDGLASSHEDEAVAESVSEILRLGEELKKRDFKFMPCPDVDLTDNEHKATARNGCSTRLVPVVPDIGSKIQLKLEVPIQMSAGWLSFQVTTCDPQRSGGNCTNENWCSTTPCSSTKANQTCVVVEKGSIVSFLRTGKDTVTAFVDGNKKEVICVSSATWDDKLFLKVYLKVVERYDVHEARIIPDDEGFKRLKDEIDKNRAIFLKGLRAEMVTTMSVCDDKIQGLEQVIERQSQELSKVHESKHQLEEEMDKELRGFKQVIEEQSQELTRVKDANVESEKAVVFLAEQLEGLRGLFEESQQALRAQVDRLQQQLPPPVLSFWLQTHDVSVTGDSLIRRIGGMDGKNYSFRRTIFEVGTQINFVVKEVDESLGQKSLTFGLTVFEPQTIPLEPLPVTGAELRSAEHADNWLVAEDILFNTKGKVVSIKRTEMGVVVLSLAGEKVVIEVDAQRIVFPFFLLDGSVSAIELKDKGVKERKGAECLFCGEKAALVVAKPCKHVLYCSECFEAAIISEKKPKCPLCVQKIADFKLIKLL